MAKEVELNIQIDKNGKVVVEPKGTSGKECLDLMKFLDKIPGFVIKETTPNKDMKDMKDEMKDFNFEENKLK
jgi:hypothetical protein